MYPGIRSAITLRDYLHVTSADMESGSSAFNPDSAKPARIGDNVKVETSGGRVLSVKRTTFTLR